MDGLENRRIIFADIPGNQQDACCNNCQISPHFLTVKGILWFFDQEQVIYVKVNSKQDHKYGKYGLLEGCIASTAGIQYSKATGAGSTGGGIKVSRIAIAFKTAKKEMSSLIHPRSIKILKYEGKPIEHTVLRSINTYLITYMLIFACSVLLISLNEFEPTTNFTAVAATLNNIGPGLEKVGPTCNFGIFSPFSKYVLMFDMLAGRLELFPMLLLFSPRTWMKE